MDAEKVKRDKCKGKRTADFVKLRKSLNVAKKKRVEYSFAYSACFVVERNDQELNIADPDSSGVNEERVLSKNNALKGKESEVVY